MPQRQVEAVIHVLAVAQFLVAGVVIAETQQVLPCRQAVEVVFNAVKKVIAVEFRFLGKFVVQVKPARLCIRKSAAGAARQRNARILVDFYAHTAAATACHEIGEPAHHVDIILERKSLFIGVVGRTDGRELHFFAETVQVELALVAVFRAVSRAHIAEMPLFFIGLEFQVDRLLVAAVLDACEFRHVRFFVEHLHLIDSVGGQVFGGDFRIVPEKFLAFHQHVLHGFALRFDGAVLLHFHAGQFAQQVFHHRAGLCLESAGVVLDRVFADADRRLLCGDVDCIEQGVRRREQDFFQ